MRHQSHRSWQTVPSLVFVLTVIGMVSNAPPAEAELKFVPALVVSERYDSNVLFATGRKTEDFVTTVAPELRADYTGRLVEGSLRGGLVVGSYAKNSNLNYVAANGSLVLNLDQLVGRLDKRAKLQVAESFFFTPELPAFVSATAGFNPFATGIQPQRVNTYTNTASANGNFELSALTNLRASYTHSILRFGTVLGNPQQGGLFRTTFQTVNAGPQFKVSRDDTVSLTYQYQQADFAGGQVPGFTTQGGTVGWARVLNQRLTMNLAAGAADIQPTNRVSFIGDASLQWRAAENSTFTFSYTRSVLPSFAVAALPLESQIFKVALLHRVTDPLTLTAVADYAHNQSNVTGEHLLFRSYDAVLRLNYAITRVLTGSLTYTYTKFMQSFSSLGTTSFDRNQVIVSLRAEWK
ncbi:MAG: hypothetical protein E6K60_09450 [Nitrospirae bacterium]|nr:MAG: hypothetical protein E6K60_09450 [Nitrospirota bacterium]